MSMHLSAKVLLSQYISQQSVQWRDIIAGKQEFSLIHFC